jgi:frataxin-like iron-binding protein CyaY
VEANKLSRVVEDNVAGIRHVFVSEMQEIYKAYNTPGRVLQISMPLDAVVWQRNMEDGQVIWSAAPRSRGRRFSYESPCRFVPKRGHVRALQKLSVAAKFQFNRSLQRTNVGAGVSPAGSRFCGSTAIAADTAASTFALKLLCYFAINEPA